MTTNDSNRRRAPVQPFRRVLMGIALAFAATPALASPPAELAVVAASIAPASPGAPTAAFDAAPAAPAPDAAAAAPGAGPMKSVLQRAMALLGTPYRWGGTSPDRGFDCSGLVGYVYRTALGVDLPRVSRAQAEAGERVVDRARMAVGDLVFFGRRGRVDHVGIYVGEGQFVHAPSRGKDVRVSSLDEGYWAGRFLQARRIAAR